MLRVGKGSFWDLGGPGGPRDPSKRRGGSPPRFARVSRAPGAAKTPKMTEFRSKFHSHPKRSHEYVCRYVCMSVCSHVHACVQCVYVNACCAVVGCNDATLARGGPVAWVHRDLSKSRTRLRGTIFGRRRGRREPGFCPTPGGREAKIGPKMGPRSRVRLLPRPRRTQPVAEKATGHKVSSCRGLRLCKKGPNRNREAMFLDNS